MLQRRYADAAMAICRRATRCRCRSRWPWPNSQRPRRTGFAAGLALFALLGTSGAWPQDLPTVTVTDSERADLVEERPISGELSATQRTRLSSNVEGQVQSLLAEAGQRVERGQALLQVDRQLSELDLEAARATRAEIRADLDDARRRLREAEELAQRDSIAQTDLRARESEVERQRAALARQESEVARQALLLQRHTLRAPFPGVVVRRMTDLGEWVEPGAAVFELVTVEQLRLELGVPQRYFGRIDSDTEARIDAEALDGEPLRTTVHEVIPDSDPDSRTFPVRIRLDNSDLRLTPGMSADATLLLDTGREGVVVPRDALIRYSDGRVVVFAVGDGQGERTVTERQVETGLAFDGRVEITNGLESGTPVVIQGNEALRDGQRVRVQRRD